MPQPEAMMRTSGSVRSRAPASRQASTGRSCSLSRTESNTGRLLPTGSAMAFRTQPAEKPAQVTVQQVAHMRRLRDAMSFARVYNVLDGNIVIEQSLID